jgi:acyl-CoA dehydrogenase
MSWDVDTGPEFQKELDWVESLVREEVEPVDVLVQHAWDMDDPLRQQLIPPLLRAQAHEKYNDLLSATGAS